MNLHRWINNETKKIKTETYESLYRLVHLQQVPMKTTAKSDYNLEDDDLNLPSRTRGGCAAHPPVSADVTAKARVPAAQDAQEGLDVGSKRRGLQETRAMPACRAELLVLTRWVYP